MKLELGSGKSGGSIASISAQGDQLLGAPPVTWLLPDEKSRDWERNCHLHLWTITVATVGQVFYFSHCLGAVLLHVLLEML